jgi:enterochelin esterase-like enzyme
MSTQRWLVVGFALVVAWAPAVAQEPSAAQVPNAPPRGGAIALGPDDKPAWDEPPIGFDQPRPDIAHGEIETVEYDSKTVGTRRKLLVYTPPNYQPSLEYNTLYLLHGISGDETEWQRIAAVEHVLDNLWDDGEMQPMIVVMPNGRAAPNDDGADGDGDVLSALAHPEAFDKFTDELLTDIVPLIESKYAVTKDREARGLAGFGMGASQALNIGLTHLDTFAWVGSFSAWPGHRPPAELIPNEDQRDKLRALYVSCGDKDRLLTVTQDLHAALKAAKVDHLYHIGPGGHDGNYWRQDLYNFAIELFRCDCE